MSYLVSFQLKKVFKAEHEEVSVAGDARAARGLSASAVIKFNNFFKQNLVKILVEETKRDHLN